MKKPASGKTRRKARPLLVAAAGATLLVLPGISSCGPGVVNPDGSGGPDLAVRLPDGNLPSPDMSMDLYSELCTEPNTEPWTLNQAL